MTQYKDYNLYEKIQMVSDEIRNIEKNIVVGTGNSSYRAVADMDVLLKVKDAEKKYGLVSIPVRQELVRTDQVQKMSRDGYQSVTFADIVKMTMRIINIDDSTQFIEVESFGRGLDAGDKGFGKASTYARKYALLNAYKLATGEDPDEQKSTEMAVPQSQDDKRKKIVDYMMQNVEYANSALQYFNVPDTDSFTSAQINSLYDNLRKKGILL